MTYLERAWTAEQNLTAMTLSYEMANRLNISARKELAEIKSILLDVLSDSCDCGAESYLSNEHYTKLYNFVKVIK